MKTNQKFIALGVTFLLAVFGIACQQRQQPVGSDNSSQKGQPVEVGNAQTPSEAYRMLYAAVKSKNTESIKQMMSEKSKGFAESVSKQQNTPIEKVFENGFTATTFAETMPPIRDERVEGDMGAVEVFNKKDNRWEDLPFVKENGSWKLAVGDLFANTFKSPGKGQAQLEMEAANTAGNNLIPYSNSSASPAANTEVVVPKQRGNTNSK